MCSLSKIVSTWLEPNFEKTSRSLQVTKAPRCPHGAGLNPNVQIGDAAHRGGRKHPILAAGRGADPLPLARDRGRAKRAAAISSVTSRCLHRPQPGWVSCYPSRDELLVWEAMIKFTCD